MPRAVILRHDLPDATWHYDWMIERTLPDLEQDPPSRSTPGPDRRCLLTLRLDPAPVPPPLEPDPAPFLAERLPDHRALYLDHEGPVSGGRGTVARVAAGVGAVVRESPDELVLEADFAGVTCRFRGTPASDPRRWHFRPLPPGS